MSILAPIVTADELNEFPNDGKRREVVGGVLHVSPAPSQEHQEVRGQLYFQMRQLVETHKYGKVYFAPVDVRFSALDLVQPDLIFIRRARRRIYKDNTVFGPPDIIMEVISPSSRSYDRAEKAKLYEANGVPEYWTFEPIRHEVYPLVLVNGAYVEIQPENGVHRSTVLPDLVIDPAVLFADLDD